MKTALTLVRFLVSSFVLIIFCAAPVRAGSPSGLWQDVDEAPLLATRGSLSTKIVRNGVVPSRYRTLHLDRAKLAATLATALPEGTLRKAIAEGAPAAALPAPAEIELPLPRTADFARFTVELSPVMEAGLAARYPSIRTYIAQGIDHPELTARLDVTPLGFHALVSSPAGEIFVDPYFLDGSEPSTAIAYYKGDYTPPKPMPCLVHGEGKLSAALRDRLSQSSLARPSGATLRVYRLALAATGEYSLKVGGGDLTMTLGAMVTSVNRVDLMYERDFAIRMVLIANEDKLIYLNGDTDPYTNDDGEALLDENQSNVDTVIGNANYDIGHVFSTRGGGVALLGVVCVQGYKANGVTGSSNPTGDPYDIDYVAHEMGHQFGANHSFNSTTNNCGGGNRSAAHAYEPGSGTTVMAYAGICSDAATTGVQDLAPHSDDYFHTTSYDEIDADTTAGGNAQTPFQSLATGNTAPAVGTLTARTIPISTPFALTASATDSNGDRLTYCWEEFDKGAAVDATTTSGLDNGYAPIFRSYPPTTNPTRTFPSLTYILNNANVPPLRGTVDGAYLVGEALPSQAHTLGLNFRCTVRDNRAGGGGSNYAAVKLTIATGAGPFVITAPNTAVSYPAGASVPVTWNVANTTLSPVLCANVRITLSTDGGLTFPFILASTVANNGSANVTLPTAASVATKQARIKVEAVGNIFFDINDANFTITSTSTPPTFSANANGISVVRGKPTATTAIVGTVAPGSSALSSVSISGVPDGVTMTGSTDGNNVVVNATAECRVTTTLTTRTYPVSVTVTDAAGATSTGTVNLKITPNLAPTLGTYVNGSVGRSSSQTVTPTAAPADGNGNLGTSPLSLSPTTALPTGVTLSLNQTTGAATFTATATATLGTTTVRLQLQDTCGAATERAFDLTVTPPTTSAPAFTNATPGNSATAGVFYSYTFAASGSPAPTYTVTAGTLPPGLLLNANSGVLAGNPTTPGIYGGIQVTASNGVAPNAVSQIFSLRVVNTVGNFAGSYGLVGANAAPGADPDDDGLSNLLEYALNLNPTQPDAGSAALPNSQVAVRAYSGVNYLSIRFTRVPFATDVSYLVESSADLVNWTIVASSTGGTPLNGAGVVTDDASVTSPHSVEVRDTIPQGNDSAGRQRFLRLRVTQP